MLGRIDYVRLRVSGDGLARAATFDEYKETCKELCERLDIPGVPYGHFTAYDYRTKNWNGFFNVWGEVSNAFFNWLPIRYYKELTRLDYRVEVSNPLLDIEHIGLTAVKRGKPNLTAGYINSRLKAKRNGRDTGGPGVYIGSKDSGRRIALYQRGRAIPAVEVQIASELLPKVVQGAYDRSVALMTDAAMEVKRALEMILQQLCRERLLHPLGAFLSMEELVYLEEPVTAQELVAEQLNLLYDALEPQLQAKFVASFERQLIQEADSQAYDEWRELDDNEPVEMASVPLGDEKPETSEDEEETENWHDDDYFTTRYYKEEE